MVVQLPRPRSAHVSALRRVHTILPARRCTVGVARRHARTVFGRWNLPQQLTEEALVVVSELVTNAVVHGAGPARMPVTLTLEVLRSRVADALMVTVADATPVSLALHFALTRCQYSGLDWSAGGRGLAIVRGLADLVEVRAEGGGKAVSALFLLSGHERLAA